ncbi:hypothetical protein CspHIS471_0506180 [Cutaneotrichosporon sp. HIS471]|nr:hypothetical protein CspHIS471_0506180 [Cutaneotrichosporon sp. HIS471]
MSAPTETTQVAVVDVPLTVAEEVPAVEAKPCCSQESTEGQATEPAPSKTEEAKEEADAEAKETEAAAEAHDEAAEPAEKVEEKVAEEAAEPKVTPAEA